MEKRKPIEVRCGSCGLSKRDSWEGSLIASHAGAENAANLRGFKAKIVESPPRSGRYVTVASGCSACPKRNGN